MTGLSSAPIPPPPDAKLSPAMRQYHAFKQQNPGYVLFFRMGDFYELFYDDATLAAGVLGIALTTRSKGGLDADDAVPMAGVPFHSVESYLRRMIAAGHRVAMCEQVEDAKTAKGVVKRDVTRLVTPGTLTDDPLLEGTAGNYLAAVAPGADGRIGVAWTELSVGTVDAVSGGAEAIEALARLDAAEVLVPQSSAGVTHPVAERLASVGVKHVTARPGWQFTPRQGMEELRTQWGVSTAAGYGFADDDPAVCAIGAAVAYLRETQRDALPHLRPPTRFEPGRHLRIDPATFRSLEIDRTTRTGGREGSLLWAIDRTQTPMGGRLLREWLRTPSYEARVIHVRQDSVATLKDAGPTLDTLRKSLGGLCDVERVVGRLAVHRAGPRDLASLGRCLGSVPELAARAASAGTSDLARHADFAAEWSKYLSSAVLPDPAPHLREGNVIAKGFSRDLDELRDVGSHGRRWLAEYQARLAAETDIPSLKIGFNRVFGYYIEVTHTHRGKTPASWSRRQSTKNAERYITDELKAFEDKALGAEERAVSLEQALFEQVCNDLLPQIKPLQALARSLAELDVLTSLAFLSREEGYCRPDVVVDRVLDIVDGRHPVLARTLGEAFVANGVRFSTTDTLQLITGPNMAGKSTFIRQTALIILLAQIGSDVPAASATVGLCDKLFARIGASDEIHAGQSTFMVEMTETANLLNNATDRSLVILDEIGRGTSTLDGLSLAWAIAEHVAKIVGCRCLFATHYHELTSLEADLPGVRNLNAVVREWDEQIVFQHRIVDGAASQSYGIQVAKLAGVPGPVLTRARELLGRLKVQHAETPPPARPSRDAAQLDLFAPIATVPPALRDLADAVRVADPDELTPKQAHDLLRRLRATLGGDAS